MPEHNAANVHIELSDVNGNKEGIENQVEKVLEESGFNVDFCHVERLKLHE